MFKKKTSEAAQLMGPKLHTNIIWSKRSTDFKELSPCSGWSFVQVEFLF